MKTRKITVLPYDPAWKDAFSAIRAEIAPALYDIAIAIEHVGSTSVEGMWAKPCIDLDVVIPSRAHLNEAIVRLSAIGYVHEGDLGIPDREAFGYEGKSHLMNHHLYVCPADSRELKRHMAFRDYLRAHPGDAARYSKVKIEAAERFTHDIEGYIRHKSGVIADIYEKLGL